MYPAPRSSHRDSRTKDPKLSFFSKRDNFFSTVFEKVALAAKFDINDLTTPQKYCAPETNCGIGKGGEGVGNGHEDALTG